MSFLSPWSFLWLGSVPVLLWLWRLVSVRRQVVVPSLVPFEHLMARTPKRRGRLAVNALFWLQLAALAGLALALAQPMLFRPHAKLTLVILDTSASMTAGDAFDRARRSLLAHLAGKPPTAQLFVVTTAPILPLLPQPTSDLLVLTRALQTLRPSHLGGNLSTAERIGRALLAAAPDETLIVTDEPRPDPLPAGSVRWISVGSPRPNAALVGLDAQGPLCRPSDARIIAAVQNFSGEAMPVAVRAVQHGRRLAETTVQLSPRERRSVSLAIPEGTEGQIALTLEAPHDALALDNRAWLNVSLPAAPGAMQAGRHATLPVVVRSRAPEMRLTLASWLGACQALTWTTEDTPAAHAALVITDRDDQVRASDAAVLLFVPPSETSTGFRPEGADSPARVHQPPVVSHWIVSPDHPIGAYLPSVGVVAAELNLSEPESSGGTPVVQALLGGRSVPIVLADERQGRRVVQMRLDPSGSLSPTPLLLVFFNSLRWLMGSRDAQTPGEPLTVAGFAPGPVRVHRPDGSTDTVESSGGAVHYEETTLSGQYRFVQGAREESAAVNFFDPLESNLSERVSTWRPLPEAAPIDHPTRPAAHPLASLLTVALLVLLLFEWWRYSVKQPFRSQGSGLGAEGVAPNPEPRTHHALVS